MLRLTVLFSILTVQGTTARPVSAGVWACMCTKVQETAAVVKAIPVIKANNCD